MIRQDIRAEKLVGEQTWGVEWEETCGRSLPVASISSVKFEPRVSAQVMAEEC